MFLLQTILKLVLTLCGVVGIAFMIASTVLVAFSIMRGNKNNHIVKSDEEKRNM